MENKTESWFLLLDDVLPEKSKILCSGAVISTLYIFYLSNDYHLNVKKFNCLFLFSWKMTLWPHHLLLQQSKHLHFNKKQTSGLFWSSQLLDLLVKVFCMFCLGQDSSLTHKSPFNFFLTRLTGKLFRSSDLSMVVEFFLMFHKDKPVDWLMDHILWVKVCNPEKDQVSSYLLFYY